MKRRLPAPLRVLALVLLATTALSQASAASATPASLRILEVRKIWDQGEHNAFTDLVRWHDRWWCTFREAADHVGGDGAIRVLESTDGKTWTSAAYVTEKDVDLRDPKFSVTPDDRLMIVVGGSVYLGTKQLKGRQPRALFSKDGRNWTVPARIMQEGEWLWRVTWHQGTAYGLSYNSGPTGSAAAGGPEWTLRLFSSRDGLKWDQVSALDVTGRPNEATVRFQPNGDLVAMVRREAGSKNGFWGVAKPPYTRWTWEESNHRFGGPNFVRAPDGAWTVGTRDYTSAAPGATKPASTMIARLGEKGKLVPLATLPSSGDNSYPGLVWHEGQLWVSYYSSHEGKTSIYLAKLAVP